MTLGTLYPKSEKDSILENEKRSLSDSLKKSIQSIKQVLKRVESNCDIDFLECKDKILLDEVFGI